MLFFFILVEFMVQPPIVPPAAVMLPMRLKLPALSHVTLPLASLPDPSLENNQFTVEPVNDCIEPFAFSSIFSLLLVGVE